MSALPWQPPALTTPKGRDLFMITLDDDTEDAPWMLMGDLEFWSASGFAHSLRQYGRTSRPDWYVAIRLPITYT